MDKYDYIILSILAACFITVLSFFGWVVYTSVTADKIVLIKNEWSCDSFKRRTSMVYSGKSVVPVVRNECQAWIRK